MGRRALLVLLLVLGLIVLAVWDLLLWPASGAGPAERASGQGLGAGGWVVVAAISGAVFTSLGAFLNDFYARQREDRLAERETEAQRERWDREDRARGEEQEEADRLRVREQRARSYKAFVAATTFPVPFGSGMQGEWLRELAERYTDVLLYCSNHVEPEAARLYDAAREALSDPDAEEHEPVQQQLRAQRAEFWEAVRYEALRDYSHRERWRSSQ